MHIHVVQQGDSAASIAKRYGVSQERIITDNGLADQPYLVVGQALIILVPKTVHTVRQSETIDSVALNYGITPMELVQKNPVLVRNPQLYMGQQLAINFVGEQDRVAAFNGYAYQFVDHDVLSHALPFMTDFSVFSYGFNDEGELIPVDDEELLALSFKYKAAPIIVLSSITEDGTFSGERASRLFNDKQLQNTVISKLIAVMKQKGYQGVDVDFEYVNPEDADAFISFLENITAQMHQNGFRVNVDLAPKTSATQQGLLYEAHDYAKIGAIADTVLLMTYEWGYTYGPPMAVAPLPNVRQVVAYAVTEIPKEKIMLGIPNYGYDWQLPFEQGVTRADSIGNEQAIQIAAENGAAIQYDKKAQSPFFEYWAPNGRKHIVWFEDVRSMQGKFNLINEFGLRGGGYWNLMRPFAQTWALTTQMFHVLKVI